MSFWIRTNIDYLEGVLPSNPFSRDYDYKLSIACVPFEEKAFKYVVEDYLKKEGFYCLLSLCLEYYPTREDGIERIIVTKESNYKFNVAISIVQGDNIPFHIYELTKQDYPDTIELLRMILIDYKCPRINSMQDVTEEYMDLFLDEQE